MDESLITPRSTRFKSSYNKDDEEEKTEPSGETSIDIFIDRVNPFNKTAHPALPNVLKQISSIRKKRGSLTAASKVSQAPAIYYRWLDRGQILYEKTPNESQSRLYPHIYFSYLNI